MQQSILFTLQTIFSRHAWVIGVIMGEFLTSKAGIGYLIIYGKQVFNLSLVYTGILFLVIISFILYKLVSTIEKK